MSETKEMTAVEFLKEWKRMCKSFKDDNKHCSRENGCPFHDKRGVWYCWAWATKTSPEEAIAIVQKWAEEHPVKTILDDFLEKFPKAKEVRHFGKYPDFCVRKLGYVVRESCFDDDGFFDCGKCWNRPLEVE